MNISNVDWSLIIWAIVIGLLLGFGLGMLFIWLSEDKEMEKRKKYGNPKNDDIRNFK